MWGSLVKSKNPTTLLGHFSSLGICSGVKNGSVTHEEREGIVVLKLDCPLRTYTLEYCIRPYLFDRVIRSHLVGGVAT